MVEKQLKNILVLSAVVLAFAYRFILLTGQTFPPGSDIGLHESVIKTISSGDTNFFVNYYHMGGGLSATNPGFHIFVSTLIAITGLPDYLAQALVASLFSTVTVLSIFLIVKKAWNEKAGYIAAFLASFSGGDIAMLSWGGYPNIIALMLIPLVFFIFLQKNRFSRPTFLATTSLLIGSIFLTHLFSSLIFVSITFLTLFFCVLFYRKTGFSKNLLINWLSPIIVGVILVSPYIYNIVPLYFGSTGTITGANIETNQALLETRAVSSNLVLLSAILSLTFFALSKVYKNKIISIPTILFATWLITPAIMTQSYLLGVYVDYERFQYFLSLPLIVCTALLVLLPLKIPKITNYLHLSINKDSSIKFFNKSFQKLVFALLSVLFIVTLFATPLLSSPSEGFDEAAYYQVMTPLKYDAIQWIKNNTLEDSVFVADASFGWWVSGFAQRPTLSAVDPQFLILAHEIEPAKTAKNLLSTDYLVDNGLIQINYLDNNTNSLYSLCKNRQFLCSSPVLFN